MEFRDAVAARHSAYMLDGDLSKAGVTVEDVVERLREIAPAVPSSFNSQSVRMIVLTGDDHRALWGIVEDVLRAKVGDDARFKSTEVKVRNFAKAAGTVLFYEIDALTDGLIEKYPTYASSFPVWAEHGNAMMQYAVWLALFDMGLGANIQHYNPIIDSRVAETFDVPQGYRLVAQIVFGGIAGEAARKDKQPGDVLVAVGHAKE
ncbi:MAG: nitroreductase family protein [Thermoplasmata archaeon]|nr:nitroreductase family protein [Thermoplasmata archaeon]